MGFKILGRFEVVAETGSLDIGGPKQRAILAALALRPNTVVPVDQLVTAIWGDEASPSARGLVRTYISRLRHALRGTDWQVRSETPGYRLVINPDDIDATHAATQLAEARSMIDGGDLRQGLHLCEHALAMWRDEPLADLMDFEFALAESRRLQEMRQRAEEWRIDANLQLGHHAELIGEIEELILRYPLREELWGTLVVALYRSGRQAEALATYQRLRHMLADELGIEPSAELQALELDVLNHADALQWTPPTETHSGPTPQRPQDDFPDADPVTPSTIQVGRPPIPAVAYQERQLLVEQLHPEAGTHGAQDALLVGAGGVGKTQLAAAELRRARATDAQVLVWVDASSRRSINEAYADAYRAMRPGTVHPQEVDRQADAFLALLATTARRWLVVLDDLPDPGSTRGLWPEGPSGRVLATTRRRDLMLPGTRTLCVDTFSQPEAASYLASRLTGSAALAAHPRVLDEADELVDDLDRLPVALAQAAAVVLIDGITCAQYRTRFADHTRQLDQLLPADAVADEYPGSLTTTWTLAVEDADGLAPRGLALPALHLAAITDPSGAPADLWQTSAANGYMTAVAQSADGEPDAGMAALRNLHRLSLLTHDPGMAGEAGPGVARMHALVQRAVLDSLAAEERGRLYQAMADALVELWPRRRRSPDDAQLLRHNLLSVTTRSGQLLYADGMHDALFHAGRILEEAKLTSDAMSHWERVTATGGRLLGPDHPDVLTGRMHLADCQGEAGDPAAAADTTRHLLTDRRRILGNHHPDTLATRHSLAWWNGTASSPTTAVEHLRNLLHDTIDTLGNDHPHTLATRNHLAYWQGEAGNPAAAADTTRHLLTDRRRILGNHHPDTLATRHSLAWWNGTASSPTTAVEHLRNLLHDTIDTLGNDHPHTLATRNHLAYWQGEAGDPAAAAETTQLLLTDRRRILGDDHPDTLATRHHLASWFGETRGPAEAIAVLTPLLTDRQRVLDADHPDTMATAEHLALWQQVATDALSGAAISAVLRRDRHRGLASDTSAPAARLGRAGHRPGRRWPASTAAASPPT